MPITATLAAASPFLLKYLLLASTASATASPALALTIGNAANAVTPDLRTDALTGRVNGGGVYSPLLAIMRARIDGYLPSGFAAAALTQAQARSLLASEAAGAFLLDDPHEISAEMDIYCRGVQGIGAGGVAGRVWSIDASVDASGDPVAVIRAASGLGQASSRAMLTIRCRHTIDF